MVSNKATLDSMSRVCHMVSDMAMTHSLSLSKKLLGKGALYMVKFRCAILIL